MWSYHSSSSKIYKVKHIPFQMMKKNYFLYILKICPYSYIFTKASSLLELLISRNQRADIRQSKYGNNMFLFFLPVIVILIDTYYFCLFPGMQSDFTSLLSPCCVFESSIWFNFHALQFSIIVELFIYPPCFTLIHLHL